MPRFSVIVPVYNVQNYLAACVKSVVEQDGPRDWECILVDDGSTDACPRMCDAFAALCPQVRVIHRANGGLAAARNTGLDAAQGEWLLFLDSDDFWPQGMLQALRAALDAAPGYDWYVGRYLELDEAAGPQARPVPAPVEAFRPGPDEGADFAGRVARQYAAGHWAVWRFCLRRPFVQAAGLRFWEEVRWAEDYPFTLLLAHACPRVYYLDVALVVYRANRAGSLLNAGLAGHLAGIAAAMQRFERLFAAPDSGWDAAQQAEVWRRMGDVFWPQARTAAVRDPAVRRACLPYLRRLRPLYTQGAEVAARRDWRAFQLLMRALGPRLTLWLAARRRPA